VPKGFGQEVPIFRTDTVNLQRGSANPAADEEHLERRLLSKKYLGQINAAA